MTDKEKKEQKKEFESIWKGLKKNITNVDTKLLFNEWLNKAIMNGNEVLFKYCVEQLGSAWGVKRNIPSEQFDKFVNHLFENGERIQNHEYKFWDEAYTLRRKSKKREEIIAHAYSYESKVCFVINPTEYSLIYDNNVCLALLSLLNFDEVARENTKDLDRSNIKAFFERDYELWKKGMELAGEINK